MHSLPFPFPSGGGWRMGRGGRGGRGGGGGGGALFLPTHGGLPPRGPLPPGGPRPPDAVVLQRRTRTLVPAVPAASEGGPARRRADEDDEDDEDDGDDEKIDENDDDEEMDTESYVVGSDSGEEEEETPDEIARRIRAQTDDIVFEDDPTDHKMGFAAIIGRPNAGKSTLMNHILGEQLSIVTAKAQTTRHKVSGIWSEPGHQVVFLDTPGIIVNQRDELEERMMTAVQQAIKDADILLAIVDVTDRPEEALDMLQPGEDWRGPPMAILLNKVDMLDDEDESALIAWYESNAKSATVFPISADTGDGVDAVQAWVVENIPEGPSMFPKDILAEANERFFVSEIIRKQVFEQYRQELPYQVTVLVTDFKERRPPQKTFIAAQVVVEKERHVKLLVGAKGSAIKALSQASRTDIESFLDAPVFLDLSVKVVPKWRSEKNSLERLGYGI